MSENYEIVKNAIWEIEEEYQAKYLTIKEPNPDTFHVFWEAEDYPVEQSDLENIICLLQNGLSREGLNDLLFKFIYFSRSNGDFVFTTNTFNLNDISNIEYTKLILIDYKSLDSAIEEIEQDFYNGYCDIEDSEVAFDIIRSAYHYYDKSGWGDFLAEPHENIKIVCDEDLAKTDYFDESIYIDPEGCIFDALRELDMNRSNNPTMIEDYIMEEAISFARDFISDELYAYNNRGEEFADYERELYYDALEAFEKYIIHKLKKNYNNYTGDEYFDCSDYYVDEVFGPIAPFTLDEIFDIIFKDATKSSNL